MRDHNTDAASGHPQIWLVHNIFLFSSFALDPLVPSEQSSMVLALDKQQGQGKKDNRSEAWT